MHNEGCSMGDLYFIEQPSKVVFVYSPYETGSWRLSRVAACQRKKLIWVLQYSQERKQWVLQDASPGSKKEIMGSPMVSDAAGAQDTNRPPLGDWRVGGYRFEVTDRMPWYAPLDPPPRIEAPFAVVQYSESGNIGRLDTKMNSTAITDEALEELLSKMSEVVHNLGRRPTMVLLLHSDAQDASVPTFKQIRRFLDWIQANGPELFLVGRGSSILLRPTGILSYTLVSIIKMVQRMLPPPWPEAIVSTSEEAEAFLEEHSRPYKGPGQAPPSSVSKVRQEVAEQASPGFSSDMPPIPKEPGLTAPRAMGIWPRKGHRPGERHASFAKVPIRTQPECDHAPPRGKPTAMIQSL